MDYNLNYNNITAGMASIHDPKWSYTYRNDRGANSSTSSSANTNANFNPANVDPYANSAIYDIQRMPRVTPDMSFNYGDDSYSTNLNTRMSLGTNANSMEAGLNPEITIRRNLSNTNFSNVLQNPIIVGANQSFSLDPVSLLLDYRLPIILITIVPPEL